MKKLFLVNRAMCGGEQLPPEFDLDEFCDVLQGKVNDFEIVSSEGFTILQNKDDELVGRNLIEEALGEYCPR